MLYSPNLMTVMKPILCFGRIRSVAICILAVAKAGSTKQVGIGCSFCVLCSDHVAVSIDRNLDYNSSKFIALCTSLPLELIDLPFNPHPLPVPDPPPDP
jgi:hypothetical protein